MLISPLLVLAIWLGVGVCILIGFMVYSLVKRDYVTDDAFAYGLTLMLFWPALIPLSLVGYGIYWISMTLAIRIKAHQAARRRLR